MSELLFGDEPRFPRRTPVVVLTRERRAWHVAHEQAAPPVRYRADRLCREIEAQLTRERRLRAAFAIAPPPRPPATQEPVGPPPQLPALPPVRAAPDLRRFLLACWLIAAVFIVVYCTLSHL